MQRATLSLAVTLPAKRSLLPDAFRLIAINRGAALPVVEDAGRRQCLIANHPRRQPKARPTGEQPVLRIQFILLGGGYRRAALIRLAGHDCSHQMFDVPAGLHEFHRQPVEQLPLRRVLRLHTKILRRLHEPDPEKRLPKTIHRDPCRQRMVTIDQPLGQAESIILLPFRKFRQRSRHPGGDFLATLGVETSIEHVRFAWLAHVLHDHHLGQLSPQLVEPIVCFLFVGSQLNQLCIPSLVGCLDAIPVVVSPFVDPRLQCGQQHRLRALQFRLLHS